ncbi:MAG TPA: ATP-binding protein, partial [Ktedonobacterales bacterium]|nr:ATP-binding protein [Ktedonobacterales bacterium]
TATPAITSIAQAMQASARPPRRAANAPQQPTRPMAPQEAPAADVRTPLPPAQVTRAHRVPGANTLASQRPLSQERREERRSANGMLPLGMAARSYAEAVDVRRQRMPQTIAEPHARQQHDQRQIVYSSVPEPEEEVCPICFGMGYVRIDVPVGDPMFGQAAPCVCKERQREERRRSDLRRISSLDAFDKKTFETFDARGAPGAREAFEVARHYADDPQGWLIFSGGYGVGKTHLAAAIANLQLAKGAHVFFSIVPDLLDHLRAAFAPSSESPFDEMFDRVREAGLLVLDDLGAENSTAWATEKLFQLINYRYNFRMPTVITTNHRLLSHIDERIRSRLSDLSLVRQVVIEAPDYRERHSGRPAPTRGRSGPRA